MREQQADFCLANRLISRQALIHMNNIDTCTETLENHKNCRCLYRLVFQRGDIQGNVAIRVTLQKMNFGLDASVWNAALMDPRWSLVSWLNYATQHSCKHIEAVSVPNFSLSALRGN